MGPSRHRSVDLRFIRPRAGAAGSDIDLFLVRPEDTAEVARDWRTEVDSLEVRVRAWMHIVLEVLEVAGREMVEWATRPVDQAAAVPKR